MRHNSCRIFVTPKNKNTQCEITITNTYQEAMEFRLANERKSYIPFMTLKAAQTFCQTIRQPFTVKIAEK